MGEKYNILDLPFLNKIGGIELFLIAGGILLILSNFFTWISFWNSADSIQYSGFNLVTQSSIFSDIIFITIAGLVILMVGILTIYNRILIKLNSVKAITLALSLASIILPIIDMIRLNLYFQNIYNIDFINNASYGWYMAIIGGVIALLGMLEYILT